MPTYDYYCGHCDTKVERIHKMNDDTEQACEECYAVLQKLITASYDIIMRDTVPAHQKLVEQRGKPINFGKRKRDKLARNR